VKRLSLAARASILMVVGASVRSSLASRAQLDNNAYLVGLINQETGLRGYINTGEAGFLEPYQLGAQQSQAAGQRIRAETNDPALLADFAATVRAAEDWRAWAALRIAVVEGTHGPVVNPDQALIGKGFFDAFRRADDAVSVLAAWDAASAQADLGRSQQLLIALLIGAMATATVAILGLGVTVREHVLLPLADLASVARRLATGAAATIPGERRLDEVGDLSRALRTWQHTLQGQKQLYNLSIDLLCVAGFDGYFKELNPAWETVTGFSREELMARPYFDFVHADDRESTLAEAAKIASGARTLRFLNRYQCKDGSYKWLDWTSAPVIEEGLMYAVARDVSEAKAATEVLAYQAVHDSLTDLPNRVLFTDRLEQSLRLADRDRAPRALLLLDLDRFKGVNDALGHAAGDQLLKQFAQRVRDRMRSSDTIARLGGDEFAVLPGVPTDVAGATFLAQKLADCVNEPFLLDGRPVAIGTSIGIAVYPEHARDAETLLRCADAAMYAAKKAGATYAVFAPPTIAAA